MKVIFKHKCMYFFVKDIKHLPTTQFDWDLASAYGVIGKEYKCKCGKGYKEYKNYPNQKHFF